MATVTEKSSTGLDANIAGALGYLFVPAIIFLAIEKDSRFVKFHAFQGLFLGLAWFVVMFALMFVGFLPFIRWFNLMFYPIAGIAFFIAWVFGIIKAFQGEMFKLPVIGDLAEQQLNK
jgi:uncharacterized membrane protein